MTTGTVRVAHARLIVAATAAAIAVVLLWLSKNYTFYFDEWTFILTAPDWTLVTYLEPHNVHPSMLFRLIYAGLLNTVGLRSYVPYMATLLLLHAVNVVLLFEVVRRRSGDLVAIAAAALLALLGAGWENLLWAFQLAWLASVALGLAMFLVLESPPRRSTPAIVAGLATLSLMFSGVGALFAVAAVVQLAATRGRRRELLWMVPVAVAVAAWYIAFGHRGDTPDQPANAINIALIPAYVAWGLGAAAAGLIGAGGWIGLVALALAVAAVGWNWWRHGADPFALGVASGLLSFYLVAGFARASLGYEQSAAGRYVYEGALLWIILLADAGRHLPWRGTWRPALVACVFLACFNSTALLIEYAAAKTAQMQREAADLQALDAARNDPCLRTLTYPDPLVMPQISSPPLYYRAVDRYGDPAPSGPVTDAADYARARTNLSHSGCR